MPALPPYIPPRDADFTTWLANFSTKITASPPTYGLAAGDATTIAATNTAWAAAYTAAVNPSTRTPATVAAKNTEKISALATVRPYAQEIANNAGVSPSDKVAVGVNARTSTPTPITNPLTNPVLTAQSTSTAGTILRYRDAMASPSVKAKPYGVIAIQIFAKDSATPITDPDTLPLVLTTTKSPIQLSLGSGTAGKTIYYAARWITRTGLVGPWSSIISYITAG